MKKVSYLLVAVALIFAATSCGNKAKNPVEGTDAQTVAQGEGVKLTVDSAQSVIEWIGSKVGGSHHGTLSLRGGEMTVNDSALVAGSFVIDMNSIVNINQTDPSMNKMLVDHLKNADFFDVPKYPEARFDITSAEPVAANDSINYRISGNLTLKAIEKNVTFGAKVSKEGDVYTAVSQTFSIDRTQWGVNYGSKTVFADLKDKILNDNIELKIKIVAKAAQ